MPSWTKAQRDAHNKAGRFVIRFGDVYDPTTDTFTGTVVEIAVPQRLVPENLDLAKVKTFLRNRIQHAATRTSIQAAAHPRALRDALKTFLDGANSADFKTENPHINQA